MPAAPGFEAWLELERESLLRAWREASLRRAAELKDEGLFGEAATLLAASLHANLLAEDVLAAYLEAAYLAGRRDEALALYARFTAYLKSELGLEPLAETERLVALIRDAAPIEPQALRAQPRRAPLTVQRPPRLVGRSLEREALQLANSPLVLVAGEPGVGKTRLLQDVLPSALWLSCREGLQAVPFQPLVALIRERLDTLPDLASYREDLARLVPEAVPGLSPAPLEPQTAKVRLLEALARFLEAFAAPVVLDDLQWADASTLEVLVYLVNRGGCRCYGSYRLGEESTALRSSLEGLRAQGLLSEVQLAPLSAEAVLELMAVLIGVQDGPPLFGRWLFERSAGNPFFALETLKALFEAGALEERGSLWHSQLDDITRDYAELETPKAVGQVIQRRFERLSEPARRVLQGFSVLGGLPDAKLLSALAGLSEWAALEALEEAETHGFVRGERFSHDLLRQSVYASLSSRKRQHLHAHVAAALEGSAEPQLVAEHWLRGGDATRAVVLWRDAAHRMNDLGLHAEAIALLERAHEHTIDQTKRAEIRILIAGQHHQLADYQKATELIEEILPQIDDVALHAKLRALQLHILSNLGKVEECARIIEDHLSNVDALGDAELRREVRWAIATVYTNLGRFDDALEIVRSELEPLEKAGPSVDLTDYLSSLGSLYDHLAQPEIALSYHQRAYQMAKAIGARHMQVVTVQNLMFCLAQLGRDEEGIGPAEEALSLGRFSRSDVLRNNLASILQRLGRYEASVPHYEYLATQAPEPLFRAVAHARLAEAWGRLGRAESVIPALEAALHHLAETDNPFALALVASRVLMFGNPDQVARIQPVIQKIDPATLNPMVRAQFEQALADHAARSGRTAG